MPRDSGFDAILPPITEALSKIRPTSPSPFDTVDAISGARPMTCVEKSFAFWKKPDAIGEAFWRNFEPRRKKFILFILYKINYTSVDLAKGYHLMTYSPTGVEATAVELQDSTTTLCRRNCKLYRLRSA